MMAEYIEREAAVESFMGEFPDAHYPSWYAEKLKEIPAADVAEVRHGEWVHTNMSASWHGKDECSECQYHTADRVDLSCFNYCPNCGAKMDGKGESDGE